MSENSGFLKLNGKDLLRGLAVAVLAAVLTSLASVFNAPGFDPATFDWVSVFRIAIGAAVGYLSKNLLSTEDGKLGGVI